MERRLWSYPVKSRERAEKRLKHDLKFFGAGGIGDCAYLDERHPKIVSVMRGGEMWWQTEVDDVVLPLEIEG